MPDPRGGYSIEDMEKWIANSRANIERLQQGIAREEVAIRHAESVIDGIREKDKKYPVLVLEED